MGINGVHTERFQNIRPGRRVLVRRPTRSLKHPLGNIRLSVNFVDVLLTIMLRLGVFLLLVALSSAKAVRLGKVALELGRGRGERGLQGNVIDADDCRDPCFPHQNADSSCIHSYY